MDPATFIDPIVYVSIFGAVAVSFLWLRDARIFARTGAPGYRTAAYRGVLFTALAWFGCAICGFLGQNINLIGIGLILLALYLQSRIKKENVWKGDESAGTRFIGSAPRQMPGNFKEVEEIKREK